jgi:hypothetical protein
VDPLPEDIFEAILALTEMRYEDPTFVGEECLAVKSGIVKMRVESWTYDCVTYATDHGRKIEDYDKEIFQEWQQKEVEKGFSLLNSSFDFDPHAGVFGQHFAFYYKPLGNFPP